MNNKTINGKDISKKIRSELEEEVAALIEKGVKPGLAVILVGDDPASKTYVKSKQKSCREIGMESLLIELPSDTPEETLLAEITKLNENDAIHGILVQLPLPSYISEMKVIEKFHRKKMSMDFTP